MTIHFGYDKRQVIQALRFHFISKPEIRIMLILVNVFALMSIALYALKKVGPFPFLVGSTLWIVLMISFWFVLPGLVYRRAATFRNEFSMDFTAIGFTLRHENGSRNWEWSALTHFIESPHFFHLYFDSRSFFLVPKAACTGDDGVAELRKMLKEYVVKK